MEWYWIVTIVIGSLVVWFALSAILYKQFFKRFYDVVLSLFALIVLSPLLLILTIVDAIAMKGNPFFTQMRPGKIDKKTGQERIFKLIKFRTMSNAKDENGNLLPDEKRLNRFGRALRQTSLDELPETLNILAGHLSIVGPRPLLVKYLPLYSEEQRRRHLVRPGLTGYAQVHGRNAISWEEKFKFDTQYVDNITFWGDIKIIFGTVFAVIAHKEINSETSATMEEFKGNIISQDKNE
ncbi:MAG: sugar transferase [Clostridia bacterium]|nr:sugar transferase [Clostridia bacterium]